MIKILWNISRVSDEVNKMLTEREKAALINEKIDGYLTSPFTIPSNVINRDDFENICKKIELRYKEREWFSEDKVFSIIVMSELLRRNILRTKTPYPLKLELKNPDKCNYEFLAYSTEVDNMANLLIPHMEYLSDDFWKEDSYFENICFEPYNDMTFKYMVLPPGMMLYNDIPIEDGYKYINKVGYVSEVFTIPCLTKGKKIVDWVLPIEVREARRAIKKATGHVVVCGSGLSYFTYLASQKENVSKITIIEPDEIFSNLIKERITEKFGKNKEINILTIEPAKAITGGMIDDANFIYLSRYTSINWYVETLIVENYFNNDVEFFYSDKNSCIEHIKNNVWSIIKRTEKNLPLILPETKYVNDILGNITITNPDNIKKLFMSDWIWKIIKEK